MSDDPGGVDPVSDTRVINVKTIEITTASESRTGIWAKLWRVGGAIAVLVFIAWIILPVVAKTIQWHSLIIDPINVPKSLVDEGMSADVVTQHLRDTITYLQDHSNLSLVEIARNRVDVAESIPDIAIPKVGVSVSAVASTLHLLLPEDWQHEISGEYYELGSKIYVRMRLNDKLVFSGAGTITDHDEIDTLINKAALKILERTEPDVAAAFLVTLGDFTDATRLVDEVIASSPPDDERVKWAYLIKGAIARQNGNLVVKP